MVMRCCVVRVIRTWRETFYFFHTTHSNSNTSIRTRQFRGVPLPHGTDSTCLGFQFGPVVYFSDVSSLPDRVLEFLISLPLLRVFIIDALRIKDTNAAHLNLPQALAVVQQVCSYFSLVCECCLCSSDGVMMLRSGPNAHI